MCIGFVLKYQKPEQEKLKKFSLLLTTNFYLSVIVSGSTIQNVSDLPKACAGWKLSGLHVVTSVVA